MERTTKRLMVCGLYRSGTNYLRELLKANLDVEMIETKSIMNKHAANDHEARYIEPDVGLVFISKTPIKWIDSMCRNSWNFIDYYDVGYRRGDTPVTIRYNVYLDKPHDDLLIPVSLERMCYFYNDYHQYWTDRLGLEKFRESHVPHGLLIRSPLDWVAEVADQKNVPFKPGEFVNPTDIPKSPPFDMAKYLDEDYVEFLSPEQVKIIKALT